MAAELEVPRRIFIHGYLLMDDHKMSKSLGNVLDPFQVMDLYGTDALRYYLLREVSFGQDGSISPEGFETRYNTELANEYGNLASRTLAMIDRYRDGDGARGRARRRACRGVRRACRPRVPSCSTSVEVSAALDEIWQRVRRLNRYVQDEAPWQLAKDPDQADRLDEVLAGLAEGLRVVSVLLHPWMPESAEKLLAALGSEDRSLEHAASAPAAAAPG